MRYRILIILLSLLSGLCFAEGNLYPKTYNPANVLGLFRSPISKTPTVIMHRGMWDSEIPENSELAFIRANAYGTAMVETDVRLTSDGVPVLFHDSGLGRMTDIYKYAPAGEMVFDPMTGQGYNPKITETPWSTIRELNYLNHPSGRATNQHLMSVEDFYNFYYRNRLNTTIFLEIKDPKSVPVLIKLLNADTRDYYYGYGGGVQLKAKDITVFKFNVNYFPFPADYAKLFSDANVPCCYYAMPSYKSNTYKDFDAKGIDMNQSVAAWSGADITYQSSIEVGLKTQGGALQDIYNTLYSKVTLGIFNAVPDLLIAHPEYSPESLVPDIYKEGTTILAKDAFYDGTTGKCCYQLSDLLSSWGDKHDDKDERSDPAYIVGTNTAYPAFRAVTTDKSDEMISAFEQAGFPVGTDEYGNFPTFSVVPLYLPLF